MSKGLVVIGGGAAGMMAAVSAAERGARVTLLEPNERLGKKLNITGKGRCNVTNNADVQTLLANVPRNGKFLYSAFSRFDGRDTMAFFASIGVPLKTERGNRVFPVSDRAFDVSAALERRLKALKVSLARDRATELEITSGAVTGVRGERGTYPAGAVVLATGGVSYPATGSTGEGHQLIPVAVERSGIPPHQKVHDLTREQRRELVQGLKHFSVEIAGPCPVTDAIVTSGGIKISEIDPKTMESKLVKGLYFSGEIMDVDAYTGGFNLQIAWATGRAAGQAAAEALRQGEENA